MKYKNLIPTCKKAIEEKKCYGCIALEIPEFVGNPNCKFGKTEEDKKEGGNR